MNLVLLQEGYCITIIPEKAHTADGDFIHLIARMVRETQKDYLRLFL
jgi:hypothetical protein